MRLTKGTLAAKDARMKLVNEMFASVRRPPAAPAPALTLTPPRSNS